MLVFNDSISSTYTVIVDGVNMQKIGLKHAAI